MSLAHSTSEVWTEQQAFKSACRGCGQEGHLAFECPEKPPATCYGCGQEGHLAFECPEKPPIICRNCGAEGHEAFGCKAKKTVPMHHVADKLPEEAWDALKQASDEREITDFKEAVQILAKSVPNITYAQLEEQFRQRGYSVYLIGMEKEIEPTQTLVNLQGKIDCKYAVFYFLSDKPQRQNMKKRWPNSAEENLERLQDAGLPMDSGVVKCNNCNELGHTTRRCPREKETIDQTEVKCFLCDQPGHRVRDCKEERPQLKSRECKNCGSVDHLARECPDKPARTCRNCGSEDHIAKECDQPRPCANCDQRGHMTRECPAPKDWSRVTCHNCSQKGHTVKRCPEPLKEELAADKGETAGYGGPAMPADTTGDDWQDNTATTHENGWANGNGEASEFGGAISTPVVGGW